MTLETYQEDFIQHLIRTDAIRFGQFQLKSGRISPYFINMGLSISDGEGCSVVGNLYAQAVLAHFGDSFDYIHGPAYKGIPLAALISEKLWDTRRISKRWGYDRKQAKTYGDSTESLLVGDLRENDRVLIIDDVMTTGQTKIDSWRVLAAAKSGISPCGVMIAVDREELGRTDVQLLEQAKLPFRSIVSASEVFDYLRAKDLITSEICSSFLSYLRDYGVRR